MRVSKMMNVTKNRDKASDFVLGKLYCKGADYVNALPCSEKHEPLR